MIFLEIAVVVLLVLLNGFFAMSELAVVLSRPSRLLQLANSGSKGRGSLWIYLAIQVAFYLRFRSALRSSAFSLAPSAGPLWRASWATVWKRSQLLRRMASRLQSHWSS
jgi:hypothetical protein